MNNINGELIYFVFFLIVEPNNLVQVGDIKILKLISNHITARKTKNKV